MILLSGEHRLALPASSRNTSTSPACSSRYGLHPPARGVRVSAVTSGSCGTLGRMPEAMVTGNRPSARQRLIRDADDRFLHTGEFVSLFLKSCIEDEGLILLPGRLACLS